MDSSSPPTPTPTPQNWLAFSISNDSHQLSLFRPTFLFNSNPSGGVVLSGAQENGSANRDNLSVFTAGGPKLEDFLGGCAGATNAGSPQFDSGSQQGIDLSDHVLMYDDSELKAIAASFLRGFTGEKNDEANEQLALAAPQPDPPAKKAVETFGQRTSIFRGVTRHRWTGRYEAHLWDNSCRREGQSRKGRQVYLGGYDKEEKAARAYDLAALKYWGLTTTTNFPVSDYEKELEEMKSMTRQEFVASLRRKSSGFSRGASIYRGVTRHHQHGRWQARIGRVAGNKDLYLGTFSTQEEAAEAYDIAAIKFRGLNAVTNFDMSRYDVRSIASSNLPVGGLANKSKTSSESLSDNGIQSDDNLNKDFTSPTSAPFPSQNSAPNINFALPMKQDQSSSLWAALGYQSPAVTNNATIPQGTTPSGMEFHPRSSVTMDVHANANTADKEGFLNVGGCYQQEGGDASSGSGPAATRIAVNGINATSHDALASGNENWSVPPSVRSYQSAKPNLSAFQTPIFGME